MLTMFRTNISHLVKNVGCRGDGLMYSPTEHNYEVHDVPTVPQVGAFMENKAKGHQLDSCLEAEDPNKIWLCYLLWKVKNTDVSVEYELMNSVLYSIVYYCSIVAYIPLFTSSVYYIV